jgi:hypothetical protein
MDRPRVLYGTVELHLSRNTEFTTRFGARVKCVGGRYSDVRGDATRRFVTLPASETTLIDELAFIYGRTRKVVVVVRDLSAEGYRRERIEQTAGTPPNVVFNWLGDEKAGPISAFVRDQFEARMDKLNWAPVLARWSAEDEQEAARRRSWVLNEEVADLQQQIAAQAVRIEQGANDIEPLKELARRYREVCAEAGIELELPASTPSI